MTLLCGRDVDLQDLGNLGEFLGAVGVIVSLIYLSLQIRHNTRAVNASSNHAIDQSFATFLTLMIENPSAAAVFAKGVGSLDALDAEERNVFYSLLSMVFKNFENAFLHYRQNLIDDSQFAAWGIAVGWYVGFPGVNTWWQNRAVVYTPEFRRFVEARNAEAGETDQREWAPAEVLPQFQSDPDKG